MANGNGTRAPSNSTYASAIGGLGSTILIIVMTQGLGWKIDAVSGASIAAGVSALAGYFFNGGRAADTSIKGV